MPHQKYKNDIQSFNIAYIIFFILNLYKKKLSIVIRTVYSKKIY